MRHDNRSHMMIDGRTSVQRQETVNFLTQLPGIARIEAIGLCSRSHHRLALLSVACIYHHDNRYDCE